MDWTNEQIITSFNGIIRDTKILNAKELESKYLDFKQNFNKLYEVAIDSVITGRVQESFELLQMMLKARSNMQNGRTTKLTTDLFVGEQLGKKYIYPKTNKPSEEDYKQSLDKIKEKIRENSPEE